MGYTPGRPSLTKDDLAKAFPDCSDIQPVGAPSGQKEVFSAQRVGQRLAIKLFKKVPGDEARIERELAAVTKLKSEYVPAVHQAGKVKIAGEERYYLIEDFVEGTSYAEILEREPIQPVERVLQLGRALLRACRDFADQRLAHRDLKPANLIIDKNGKLWVIDFGLVRHLDLTKVTPTGYGVGTVGYAPIEQWRIVEAEVNSRADLFAVGVILYEALHGQNPWREKARDQRNNLEVIDKMKTQELTPLRIHGDVQQRLSGFIAWLTQRFPSRRPQTTADAYSEFETIHASLNPNR